MKKLFYTTFLLFIVLVSCKKTSSPTTNNGTANPTDTIVLPIYDTTAQAGDTSLIGKWLWVEDIGGLTGGTIVLPPPDTLIVLVLNADSTYYYEINGQKKDSGVYHIQNVVSIYGNIYGSMPPAIYFVSAIPPPPPPPGSIVLPGSFILQPRIIDREEPHLTFVDNHVEPFGSIYRRVH